MHRTCVVGASEKRCTLPMRRNCRTRFVNTRWWPCVMGHVAKLLDAWQWSGTTDRHKTQVTIMNLFTAERSWNCETRRTSYDRQSYSQESNDQESTDREDGTSEEYTLKSEKNTLPMQFLDQVYWRARCGWNVSCLDERPNMKNWARKCSVRSSLQWATWTSKARLHSISPVRGAKSYMTGGGDLNSGKIWQQCHTTTDLSPDMGISTERRVSQHIGSSKKSTTLRWQRQCATAKSGLENAMTVNQCRGHALGGERTSSISVNRIYNLCTECVVFVKTMEQWGLGGKTEVDAKQRMTVTLITKFWLIVEDA